MKSGTDNFSFTTVVKLKLQVTCKQFRCTCLIGNTVILLYTVYFYVSVVLELCMDCRILPFYNQYTNITWKVEVKFGQIWVFLLIVMF